MVKIDLVSIYQHILSALSEIGRGTGTETYGFDSVIPDDLRISGAKT